MWVERCLLFMVVNIDLLQIKYFGKQNGRQIAKLMITHSIFKLEAPDFAWQFIVTLCLLRYLKIKFPPLGPSYQYKNGKDKKSQQEQNNAPERQLLVLCSTCLGPNHQITPFFGLNHIYQQRCSVQGRQWPEQRRLITASYTENIFHR